MKFKIKTEFNRFIEPVTLISADIKAQQYITDEEGFITPIFEGEKIDLNHFKSGVQWYETGFRIPRTEDKSEIYIK